MRVFLTGGTGFVGHHAAKVLAERGDTVIALVRKGSNTGGLAEIAGVELCEGQLLNPQSYAAALEGCDALIHCAGAIKALSLAEYLRVNADGAEGIARAAFQAGVPRFHLVSSIAARGPILSDGSTNGPVSDYGRSKLVGEQKVLALEGVDRRGGERGGPTTMEGSSQGDQNVPHRPEGSRSPPGCPGSEAGPRPMQVTITRPPPVYGPRDTGMLSVFKAAASGVFPLYGRGRNRVAMVHVSDLVAAIVALVSSIDHRPSTIAAAADSGMVSVGPYYPEDGSNPSWRELAEAFARASGRRVQRIPLPPPLFWIAGACASGVSQLTRKPGVFGLDKVREAVWPNWTADSSPLTAATGWRARVLLDQGLADTMRWYRDNGWIG